MIVSEFRATEPDSILSPGVVPPHRPPNLALRPNTPHSPYPNLAKMDVDFDELEDATLTQSADTHPDTAKILADLDRKQAARQLALPTNDGQVRALLREQGEPVTLFGERPEDRRDRLRALLARQRTAQGDQPIDSLLSGSDSDDSSDEEMDDQEEEFYTEGTFNLKLARRSIADYSLPR